MFQYRYEPLLSVQFKHPYYLNGVSKDFDCLPTAATVDLLQEYSLKLAQTKGGLKILCQKEYTDAVTTIPLIPIDQPLDLFFVVQVNSDILNLSDLAGLPKRYWLSNQNADGTFKENLALGATLGSVDELALSIAPLSLQLALPPGLYRQIQVNKLGETPIRQMDVLPTQETFNLTISQPGQYRVSKIKADGTRDETNYLLDQTLHQASKYWAVLHLRLDATIDYDPANAVQYTVNLPHKQSTWRYFVALSKARQTGLFDSATSLPMFSLTYEETLPYPDTSFALKPNANWTAEDLAMAGAIRNDKTAAVFLFETALAVPLFEANSPIVTLLTTGAKKMLLPTPRRDQYTTNLFVHL